ncbi:MAG: T9SS type A sorting domain-containing protein [bacterium]|nr:T9SS type A sorting domain-containing protein [bacterium]
MERRILLLIVCLSALVTTATAQSLVWSKHYGGYFNEGGYGCQTTADGGYVAIGSTYSFGSGDHDLYIIRLDSLGDTLWAKTAGGTGTDYGRDLQVTADNGFLCVGSTTSSGAGGGDLLLVKYNQYGDQLWSKTIGGTAADEGWSIRATSDSNYIICGTTSSTGAGYADLWLVKVDESGNLLWSKTFGGVGGESGMAVRETWDGYVAIGSTGSFGTGYSSIYMVKTSFDGDSLWAISLGGSRADYGYSLEITPEFGLLVVGATNSYGLGYNDAYVIKTTAGGTVEWERTFGGTRDDRAYAVSYTADGNYVITGTTESSGAGGSDIYVLKIDPLGQQLWSTTQGGTQSDYCRSICVDSKGNYLLAGYTYSYSIGGSDLYLATLVGDQATPVEDDPVTGLPFGYVLDQNYPNPFNAGTTIEYALPRRAEIGLAIYNLLGQVVKRWPLESQPAGHYRVFWDGRTDDGHDLASGVYFFRLEAVEFHSVRKLVLLK